MNDKEKTGIFLTGGGAIGSFHIGFFKALEEFGIDYDYVFGCSAGAIIAGAMTYLSAAELYDKWKQLTLENVFKIDSKKVEDFEGIKRTLILYKECIKSCCRRDPNLFIDVNDIRKLLYDLLNGEKMIESQIDFGISTTLLPSMKMENIWKENMETNPLEYILASMYLPIFSRQRIIDDRHYMDLCRFRRYPLEVLKEKGCTNIYVVNIESNNIRKLTVPIERDLSDETVTFIDYDRKPSILDFSRYQTEKNYETGYETTVKVLTRKRQNR